jgi:hypothetical protein
MSSLSLTGMVAQRLPGATTSPLMCRAVVRATPCNASVVDPRIQLRHNAVCA